MPARKPTTETATLRACLDYLKLCRIVAWRINSMGVPIPSQPGRFRPGPSRGVADILGIAKAGLVPVALAVEVKSERGLQSTAQHDFESQWVGAGGVYLLVRSVHELKAGLMNAGIKVR